MPEAGIVEMGEGVDKNKFRRGTLDEAPKFRGESVDESFLDAKAKVEKIKAAQRLAEQRLKEDRAKFEPIKDSEAMQVYRDYLIRMRDAFRQVGDDGEGLSADGETVVKLNAEERLRKYDQAAGVKSAIDLLDRMCNR